MRILQMLTHEMPPFNFKFLKHGLYGEDVEVMIVDFLHVVSRKLTVFKGRFQLLEGLRPEERIVLQQMCAFESTDTVWPKGAV